MMTKPQLALMRSLTVAGAVALLVGVVLLVFDLANPQEVCSTSILGYESCHTSTSNRGAWIAGGAVLFLACTFVAWSTLSPSDAPVRKSGRGGSLRGLWIILGGLFVLVVVAATIDIATS
ncbi:hypothetical protein [Nocardia farcinica]|uniref:Transmembrane protein n=1 Tax=Nocardia farcinica (strain IFM 10152) TaxID=247156 RepID=Q5YZJ1_NOCFA|nr:hypothetical protein [Nocardia farcinica]BAD56400.1 hypothetical protein NFA_15550 [Nocardia farcinica IFM 10152]